MVVIYHGVLLVQQWYGIQPAGGVYNFGYAGVHLFFVISGFIIYYAHYADTNSPAKIPYYLGRRSVRIYPLYWLVFFVWGGWRVFIGRFDAEDFLSNALLFTSAKKLVVPVSWTLAHEMVFYLLFTVFIANRKVGYILSGAWFAIIVANYFGGFSHALPLRLPNLLFVIGLAASWATMACMKNLGQARREYLGMAGLVIGCMLFAATAQYSNSLAKGGSDSVDVWGNPLITVGYGAASAMILLSSLSDKLEGFVKSQNLALVLGNASYSIYLVHFYIQRMAFNLTRPVDFIWSDKSALMANLLLVFVVLTSVVVGVAIHKFVEKPMLAGLQGRCKKI